MKYVKYTLHKLDFLIFLFYRISYCLAHRALAPAYISSHTSRWIDRNAEHLVSLLPTDSGQSELTKTHDYIQLIHFVIYIYNKVE